MIGRYMEARRDIHPGEVKITKCPLLLVDHYHFRLKSLFKSHLFFLVFHFHSRLKLLKLNHIYLFLGDPPRQDEQ